MVYLFEAARVFVAGGEERRDGQHRHRGVAEGAAQRRAGAQDEDRVHAGTLVAVGADAGEAASGGDERRPLQFLPWHPRVPPGDPRQSPRRHAQHPDPLCRHARHQGASLLLSPPAHLYCFRLALLV